MRSGTTSRNRGESCLTNGLQRLPAKRFLRRATATSGPLPWRTTRECKPASMKFPTLSLGALPSPFENGCRVHRRFSGSSRLARSSVLATAQAIHRNLVKIPTCHFVQMKEHPGIARYLRGAQSIGVVDQTGRSRSRGCKAASGCVWSSDLGIIIESTSDKEEQ